MKSHRHERLVLLVADILTMGLSWLMYYHVRVRSGLVPLPVEPEFFGPMFVVTGFWLTLFALVGLYRPWYAASRFDELALLFKTATVGCGFLFFAVFVDDQGQTTVTSSRILIVIYWSILLLCIGAGRLALRSLQRRMLIAGIGAHNTLIVGSVGRSRELFEEVSKYPALGYRVVGYVGMDHRRVKMSAPGMPALGVLDELPVLIAQRDIKDVLIALESKDHTRLLEIIAKCSGTAVGMKIVPDLYDVISGQARTNQIYGFPLIEISPQLMPPWELATKRLIDSIASAAILVVGFPAWIVVALAIKLDSPGPVLYTQERVGKDGAIFIMHKFRSMYRDAEKAGPQWAHKKDHRVTGIGRILRQLHLDEIPQFWNVLKGDMSLIGPRPERPVFVERLTREIPLYKRRLKVRPGITGWAQVKHKYDESVEDVRKKVQYDLFYIENMSLRMDFKIILSTLSHMLLGKGH